MTSLGLLSRNAEDLLRADFHIVPEQSRYCLLSHTEYGEFTRSAGLDSRSLSVYLPRHLAAIINQDSEFVATNFLHEYYGHGLYCEHAQPGRAIVELERRLVNVPAKKQLLIDTVDAQRPTFEGFATWIEGYLAKELGFKSIFEQKLSQESSRPYRELYDYFNDKESAYGKYAMMFQLGFPRHHAPEVLRDVLDHIYGDDSKSIELCLLYGSKKPYSDIDLFIVSDSITSESNEWLDVNARSHNSFEDCIAKLDISVTDPLLTGDAIIDPPGKHKALRHRLLTAPITCDAIQHNALESERKRQIAETYPVDNPLRWYGVRISETHRIVAEQLREGRKLLTFKDIREAGLLPNLYKSPKDTPS